MIRLKCVTARISSAFAQTVVTEDNNTTNALDWVAYQYVSDPIGAQTITGTVTCWVLCRESISSGNYFAQLVVRVVSNDGATVRGTLVPAQAYTGTTGSSIRATTTSNAWGARAFPVDSSGVGATAGTTVSSVTAQNNDRVVIEFGHRANNTVSTAITATYDVGDNNASDVTTSEANVTGDLNPWLEFSVTLAGPSAAVTFPWDTNGPPPPAAPGRAVPY